MTLVQSQSHVDEVAHEEGRLLSHQLVSLDGLKRAAGGEERLDQPDDHHAHHHYGEDGYGVATHVHDQQVHWHLLNRSQGQFPGLFDNQMALVSLFGHLAVVLSGGWVVTGRGGILVAFGNSPAGGN